MAPVSNAATALFVVLFVVGIVVFLLIEWLNERHEAKMKEDDSQRGFEVLPPKGEQ